MGKRKPPKPLISPPDKTLRRGGREPFPVPGFHGVCQALNQQEVAVMEVWLATGRSSSRVEEVLQLARDQRVPVLYREPRDMDRLLPGLAHQGMVALMADFPYADLTQLVRTARSHPEPALLLALDHITDEGNLGAILRTAAFFGAHGVLLPKDRSARVSPQVVKRSAGAFGLLPVARVVNLARSLQDLEREGFWIIGTSGQGRESLYGFDWDRDLVLVLGNEERGMGQAIQAACQETVHIPASGAPPSLNVAVACGVLLSEIKRQQHVQTQEPGTSAHPLP